MELFIFYVVGRYMPKVVVWHLFTYI